ncbi:MAG: hypothetical protein O3B84_06025 [Chloroflexi bacterium]|nr:hypothetical protein [Chloroflexota bacterium]
MEMLELIDRLEDLIDGSGRVPLTGKRVIDVAAVGEIIDRLRATVPQEVLTANDIRSRGESILSDAVLAAKQIRASAERERKASVEQSIVVREAEERAAEMHLEAEGDAERIRKRADADAAGRIKETDGYAEMSLARLGAQLAAVKQEVSGLQSTIDEMERGVESGTRFLQARWTKSATAKTNGESRKGDGRGGDSTGRHAVGANMFEGLALGDDLMKAGNGLGSNGNGSNGHRANGAHEAPVGVGASRNGKNH